LFEINDKSNGKGKDPNDIDHLLLYAVSTVTFLERGETI
jgi:hypothetical protein